MVTVYCGNKKCRWNEVLHVDTAIYFVCKKDFIDLYYDREYYCMSFNRRLK